eukprot:scaffold37840_cov58-Phaeocystis_antarctica.AAC.3
MHLADLLEHLRLLARTARLREQLRTRRACLLLRRLLRHLQALHHALELLKPLLLEAPLALLCLERRLYLRVLLAQLLLLLLRLAGARRRRLELRLRCCTVARRRLGTRCRLHLRQPRHKAVVAAEGRARRVLLLPRLLHAQRERSCRCARLAPLRFVQQLGAIAIPHVDGDLGQGRFELVPRLLAREHLPAQHAERVHVGRLRYDRPALLLATKGLWWLVRQRATPSRGGASAGGAQRGGQAKVRDEWRAVGGDQHVLWLQVERSARPSASGPRERRDARAFDRTRVENKDAGDGASTLCAWTEDMPLAMPRSSRASSSGDDWRVASWSASEPPAAKP